MDIFWNHTMLFYFKIMLYNDDDDDDDNNNDFDYDFK